MVQVHVDKKAILSMAFSTHEVDQLLPKVASSSVKYICPTDYSSQGGQNVALIGTKKGT